MRGLGLARSKTRTLKRVLKKARGVVILSEAKNLSPVNPQKERFFGEERASE